jgi:hypothetical protein
MRHAGAAFIKTEIAVDKRKMQQKTGIMFMAGGWAHRYKK